MPGRDDLMTFRVRLRSHQGAHPPVSNARRRWGGRASWIVELDDGTIRGFGEASPLPGHSRETLEEARADLEPWLDQPWIAQGPVLHEPGAAWLREVGDRLTTPSARFAMEMALLDAWSRRLRVPAWRLLTGQPVASSLVCSEVLDPLDDEALERAERALRDGLDTLKLKVGRDAEAELAFAARLREIAPPGSLRLRIDANRSWPPERLQDELTRWASSSPEYVEEPSGRVPGQPHTGVPLALDESLLGVAPDAAWLEAQTAVRAVVLKPMLLGGIVRCLEWAEAARRAGKAVVVSHSFDGPLALAACAQLAFAVQTPPRAAGLSLHRGLAAWRSRSEPPAFVHEARIELPDAPGLGTTYTNRLSLRAAARECPDRIALVGGNEELTYETLARRVERVAAWLEAEGVADVVRATGRPLAFVAEARPTALALLYTCIELGWTVLPLHPRSTPEARSRQVAELRPAALLDGAALLRLEAVLEAATKPDPEWKWTEPEADLDDELDLAWLCTSGTSGAPRAIRLSRRAFLASADASAEHLGWRDDDRWLLSLPFAHVGGLSVLTRCLIARRTVVVDEKPPADEWLAELKRRRVTLLSLVPTQLARLLEIESLAFPPAVRAVLVGGARAPAELIARARRSGIPALRTYGMTEACSQIATEPLAEATSIEVVEAYVGKPLFGIEVRIAASGAVQVRGATLCSGIVDRSGTTGGARTPPPEWLDTSDRGRLDDDGLYVFGRLDHVVISGGENVAPEGVEAVIAAHPDVIAVCVTGVADPRWGERVVALVVLRTPTPVDELAAWAKSRLAPQERPARWCVVRELPLLPNGKIDRRAAGDLARSP